MFSPSVPTPEPPPTERVPDLAGWDADELPSDALPVPSLLDGGVQRLDPRYVSSERIGGGIFAAVLLVAGALGIVFYALGSEARVGRIVFLALLLAALVTLAALSAWFYPPLKIRHCRWRLSPSALEIRRGVWFRHWISVPRARVQHTDVERGPLARRFGLAALVVHTAGHQDSEVRLEGLEHGVALALRDRLLAAQAAAREAAPPPSETGDGA